MAEFTTARPGLTATRSLTVEEGHTVVHTGRAVLSSPIMISLMESVAMYSVQPFLPEGFTTVGYEVHVRHKAPALVGAEIVVTSTLLEADGRKLLFGVRVSAGEKTIGEGTHRRTIIPMVE